jgi:mRNA-degrading endonuclease RelE of RelBE toxin-antitoxin system
MAFEIEIALSANLEIRKLKIVEQRRVSDAIEQQLRHEPEKLTRNRKRIDVSVSAADFDFEPPLWELRVGEIRVFYDVDAAASRVAVRAVRRKPPEKTTGEVIRAKDHG